MPPVGIRIVGHRIWLASARKEFSFCLDHRGMGGRPGGRPMPNIMARAFSAAAAAAMMLLFSASERRGERKRSEGSIPGGSG